MRIAPLAVNHRGIAASYIVDVCIASQYLCYGSVLE